MVMSILFRDNNKEELPNMTGTEIAVYDPQDSFDFFITSLVNNTIITMISGILNGSIVQPTRYLLLYLLSLSHSYSQRKFILS